MALHQFSKSPFFSFCGFTKKDNITDKLQKINALGGTYENTKKFSDHCTHVICKQPVQNEIFLGACLTGKWILIPKYIFDCYEQQCWLQEDDYEWKSEFVADDLLSHERNLYDAPKRCRMYVKQNGCKIFRDWKVLLLIDNTTISSRYSRLLELGSAEIVNPFAARNSPESTCEITHTFFEGLQFEQLFLLTSRSTILRPEYIDVCITEETSLPPIQLFEIILPVEPVGRTFGMTNSLHHQRNGVIYRSMDSGTKEVNPICCRSNHLPSSFTDSSTSDLSSVLIEHDEFKSDCNTVRDISNEGNIISNGNLISDFLSRPLELVFDEMNMDTCQLPEEDNVSIKKSIGSNNLIDKFSQGSVNCENMDISIISPCGDERSVDINKKIEDINCSRKHKNVNSKSSDTDRFYKTLKLLNENPVTKIMQFGSSKVQSKLTSYFSNSCEANSTKRKLMNEQCNDCDEWKTTSASSSSYKTSEILNESIKKSIGSNSLIDKFSEGSVNYENMDISIISPCGDERSADINKKIEDINCSRKHKNMNSKSDTDRFYKTLKLLNENAGTKMMQFGSSKFQSKLISYFSNSCEANSTKRKLMNEQCDDCDEWKTTSVSSSSYKTSEILNGFNSWSNNNCIETSSQKSFEHNDLDLTSGDNWQEIIKSEPDSQHRCRKIKKKLKDKTGENNKDYTLPVNFDLTSLFDACLEENDPCEALDIAESLICSSYYPSPHMLNSLMFRVLECSSDERITNRTFILLHRVFHYHRPSNNFGQYYLDAFSLCGKKVVSPWYMLSEIIRKCIQLKISHSENTEAAEHLLFFVTDIIEYNFKDFKLRNKYPRKLCLEKTDLLPIAAKIFWWCTDSKDPGTMNMQCKELFQYICDLLLYNIKQNYIFQVLLSLQKLVGIIAECSLFFDPGSLKDIYNRPRAQSVVNTLLSIVQEPLKKNNSHLFLFLNTMQCTWLKMLFCQKFLDQNTNCLVSMSLGHHYLTLETIVKDYMQRLPTNYNYRLRNNSSRTPKAKQSSNTKKSKFEDSNQQKSSKSTTGINECNKKERKLLERCTKDGNTPCDIAKSSEMIQLLTLASDSPYKILEEDQQIEVIDISSDSEDYSTSMSMIIDISSDSEMDEGFSTSINIHQYVLLIYHMLVSYLTVYHIDEIMQELKQMVTEEKEIVEKKQFFSPPLQTCVMQILSKAVTNVLSSCRSDYLPCSELEERKKDICIALNISEFIDKLLQHPSLSHAEHNANTVCLALECLSLKYKI